METVFTYNTPHLVYWDWRIAMDLFLGGTGVGAFLVAAFNSLHYKDRFPLISKVGAVLSPLLVALGLVFLITELGHPLRMWRTIAGFNISSPLSWGGLFQGLMIGIGGLYALVWLWPGLARFRRVVGVLGIPVALIVGAYHGWLLTIVTARPLWNTGPATVAALLSFAITGMAAILLVVCLLGQAQRSRPGTPPSPDRGARMLWMIRDFRSILILAMIAQGFTFFIWWISLYYGSHDARAALAAANQATGPLFWIVGIGVGLIIPIVLQLVDMLLYARTSHEVSLGLTVFTVVLILVGGFVFRYAVVIGGQVY